MEADHEYLFSPLPPLFDISPSQLSEKLPKLRPLFFVPPLEERPQNPIVEAISDVQSPSGYKGGISLEEEGLEKVENEIEVNEEDTWVYKEKRLPQNHVLSWDALRNQTFPRKPVPTPFLSEQPSDVFDAVRHYVQPRIEDPTLELKYVLPGELLEHLLMNVLGNSSLLYIWDSDEERFVPSPGRDIAKVLVIIEGLDSVTSASIIGRFLNIGTKFRRIEMMVMKLKSQNGNPTLHAFLHALSTLLVHLRTVVACRPPYPVDHLISIWAHYSEYEELLSALAFLCHRHRDPPYYKLPESPVALLSHIFDCLEKYIDQAAERKTIAALAYILTVTSKDYFSDIGESIGLCDLSRAPWLRLGTQFKIVARNYTHTSATTVFDLDHPQVDFEEPSPISASDEGKEQFPTFFPKELVAALPVARKSLSLLHAADPEHELSFTPLMKNCEWVWSEEEVERLWISAGAGTKQTSSFEKQDAKIHVIPRHMPLDPPVPALNDYASELDIFKVFDLEPGTHIPSIELSAFTHSNASANSISSPYSFLTSFPHRLPPLTPTLSHLAGLVLEPLIVRTTILSNSILELFLGPLQLQAHLEILKSFLLLTHYPFKRRLVDALFEDEGAGRRQIGAGKAGLTLERLGIKNESDDKGGENYGDGIQHAIGLSSGLTQRGTWPPSGADLSFFLRSVVVDSINERVEVDGTATSSGTGVRSQENVWKEARVRLGFALRDLPIGDGKGKWLNPMSIEALDFLYLDYKPPYPIDVIITPVILSKYQRVFTFVLRLFRAEMVARMAYRCTFKFPESSPSSTPLTSRPPVFSYAPKAQAMLINLRFQIQSFVTSFTGYIFDSAIGANFDSYLATVSELHTGNRHDRGASADFVLEGNDKEKDTIGRMQENATQEHDITDVFTLRDSHSHLLDRILNACLLRTAQRPAGDALRDLLDTLLQFGALLADLKSATVRETEGVERIEEIYWSFRKKMFRFIGIIQAMHAKEQDRDQHKSNFSSFDIETELQGKRDAPEARSYLEDLMTRIDPTRWWRQNWKGGQNDLLEENI